MDRKPIIDIVKTVKELYYITIYEDGWQFNTDFRISKLIGLSVKKYRKICINELNATLGNNWEVYYKSKEDAGRAGQWIESVLLVNKLRSVE